MDQETSYTPGHSKNSTEFMAQRSFASHGAFFAPYIETTSVVLDVGCGPGSMSLGIAKIASSGRVHGVDFGESQVGRARDKAEQAAVKNLEFTVASCYELPFEEHAFDCVFCHALMEHLSRPVDALREFARVLKPGGWVGVCSPDFDGLLMAPWHAELQQAVDAYAALQRSNGGNLQIGKDLGRHVSAAGFVDVSMEARYECYPSLTFIADYLAAQLDQSGMSDHAACLRKWSSSAAGMFAQAWVAAVGRKRDV